MQSNMTTWAAAAIAGFALAAAATAGAETPSEVRIKRISYAGTGCRAGSVAQSLSRDKQAFTLLFDSYVATAGPGLPIIEKRKNCAISVLLEFPQGWTYTLVDVDYRGYVDLQRGVEGTQKVSYYFQGESASATLETPFRGPTARDYHLRDEFALESLVWAPCGANRALNLNTQVRVDNSRNLGANGMLTVDALDGVLTHKYGLRWQRCR